MALEISSASSSVDNAKSLIINSLNDAPRVGTNQSSSSRGYSSTEDTNDAGMKELYKSLTVLGDKVMAKLDEILKKELPGGVRSLKPEDHTAEKTADRISSGVLAMFSAYEKQNPTLKGEELLNSFMEKARSGVKQGYDDAYSTLGSIGAFQFDGVESGIAKTMELVEQKFQEFEKQYLADNAKPDDSPKEPESEKSE